VIVASFLLGSGIYVLIKKPVRVEKNTYTLKDGFPIFTDEKAYITLVKNYPYNFGVKILIHTMRTGESLWDVAYAYHVSIDTLIAANPFLTTLSSHPGVQVVVPEENGVLTPVRFSWDVYRMSRLLPFGKKPSGKYLPFVFDLFCQDDMRFVFFRDAKPGIVNDSLEGLYNIRKIFRTPVNGRYSSMFGERVDPFNTSMSFHNGIDIQSYIGAPIHPIEDGMVCFAGWFEGFGLAMVIQHPDGYVSMYGHCSALKAKKGDFVTKDTVIALVGSTGRSTGPHLHFSLFRHGDLINPLYYIW
jgi:murein DD-endopeptidase MepM/ murein hydrolase activator NlpD